MHLDKALAADGVVHLDTVGDLTALAGGQSIRADFGFRAIATGLRCIEPQFRIADVLELEGTDQLFRRGYFAEVEKVRLEFYFRGRSCRLFQRRNLRCALVSPKVISTMARQSVVFMV